MHHPGEGRPGPPPQGRGPATAAALPGFDPADCQARIAVECGINRLKRNRALATRYDRLAVRYGATVCITATSEWPLPHLDQASGEVFEQRAGQAIW